MEENITVAGDRTAWREISCVAGAAKVGTDDAEKVIKVRLPNMKTIKGSDAKGLTCNLTTLVKCQQMYVGLIFSDKFLLFVGLHYVSSPRETCVIGQKTLVINA